jgi:endonuclease/exonuclease/phosphatase family metal-dependent hydrolase
MINIRLSHHRFLVPAVGLFSFLLLAGCGTLPPHPDLPQTGLVRTPEIVVDAASGTASTQISVLIYNVAGLPWPASRGKYSRKLDENGKRIPIDSNRRKALRAIGDTLGEMRAANRAPDVIMLQEAFISPAAEIVERGGYPNSVTGPDVDDLGRKYSERATKAFIAERSFWKGEKLGKWQSSGLLLASDFPILRSYKHPFNQWECAGFDCLANKGVLVVVIDVPGVPQPVALATVHYNSRGSSGVADDRSLIAHNLQVAEADEFLRGLGQSGTPFIWGGDLNMRHADDRIRYFVERSGGKLNEVSSFCVDNPNLCEVVIRWDTDTPWHETQDLQGWLSGTTVRIKPVRVEELFEEPVDGFMPSDHDGLLVNYRLSWSSK